MVTDDEDRENEGDCICAAEFATTENVNFMATYARGLICMPMSRAWCERLDLPQMVQQNTDNHQTAFTVSIDGVETTTGISAEERSMTARACVREGARPRDFRRPGHMFPLQARPGGGYRTGGHKRTRARRPADPRAEFVEGTVEADHRPATLRDRARRRVHQGAAPEGDHGAGAR